MNHENECLINKTLSISMLLHIISVSFNSNNGNSKVIDISKYLKFVKVEKNNQIINSSVKGIKLYQDVMTRTYFDIFQTVIYQYNKNVLKAYETTNLIFKTRYPFAKCPSFNKVSKSWMNHFF